MPFAGGLWDLTLYGGWHTTPEECVVAVKRYDRDSDSSNARPRGLYVRGRGL
ncbi:MULTISPECIES: deazapurine DNA modification protein DpdA family protein [Mycobacteriaceae]|uniref:deazapurine DNA modification protein DpdA family protein n=1 Tax=Mycobacteriaceae TaxID=1762 RepID=UPI003AB962D1